MTPLPCAYAAAPAAAIAEFVAGRFDLPPIASCRFWWRGFNDLYIIAAGTRRLVLRLSRAGRRRDSDLEYEAALLVHVGGQGVAAPVPLRGRDNHYAQLTLAADGVRPALLFEFIPGRDAEETPADMYGQGVSLARFHAAAADFTSPHDRFTLDLDYLLDRALQHLEPLLDERNEDRTYLASLAGRLRERAETCVPHLTRGVCHGDCHGFNARINEAGVATLLDFDEGGPGWLTYDLAVWMWSARAFAPARRPLWQAFLAGYRSQRPVAFADLDAIRVFVPIRHLWLLGQYAHGAPAWGTKWVGPWLDKQIAFFKAWEEEPLQDPLGLDPAHR
jgi:Ser/Thr protein kinase RdoA (MazF antagonist)